MNSLDEVLKYRAEMYSKSYDLVARKGKEYCGKEQDNGDSLHNYRIHAKIGWNDREEDYPIGRVLEKLQRLHSMLKNEEISTEKFEEDIHDIHNILDYVGLMRRSYMMREKQIPRVKFKSDPSVPPGEIHIKNLEVDKSSAASAKPRNFAEMYAQAEKGVNYWRDRAVLTQAALQDLEARCASAAPTLERIYQPGPLDDTRPRSVPSCSQCGHSSHLARCHAQISAGLSTYQCGCE